jgi:hypothetical protein
VLGCAGHGRHLLPRSGRRNIFLGKNTHSTTHDSPMIPHLRNSLLLIIAHQLT